MFTVKNFAIGGSFDDGGNVEAISRPIPFNMPTSVAFSMKIKCHGGTSNAAACQSILTNANDPHFTFNLWVRILSSTMKLEFKFSRLYFY